MAAEGLFEVANKLFVRRGHDLLVLTASNTKAGDFPGGRMSPEDTLFDFESSMKREIVEELGTQVNLIVGRSPCFAWPYRSKNDTQEVLGLAYLANYEGGDIVLSDEHTHMQWIPAPEALPLYETYFLDGLQRYLALDSYGLGENPIIISAL